jgi:hypothetical protein
VYRTAAGFRLLLTSQSMEPASAASRELLNVLGSDPLYQRLCTAQSCFRARLSPKYWRCGCDKPPSRFPWADGADEARYRQWERDYGERARPFAVCAFVGALGSPTVDDSVQPILDLHDRLTLNERAPLA